MDTTKLLTEKLSCPKCLYPVIPVNQAGTACPRCNTWLDLDSQCLGSCLSCHKMKQANPSPCLSEASEIPAQPAFENVIKDKVAKGTINEVLQRFLGKLF